MHERGFHAEVSGYRCVGRVGGRVGERGRCALCSCSCWGLAESGCGCASTALQVMAAMHYPGHLPLISSVAARRGRECVHNVCGAWGAAGFMFMSRTRIFKRINDIDIGA